MLMIVLILAVGVATYYLVSWNYERQLRKVNKIAEKLSSGELTVKPAHFHIGQIGKLSNHLITLRDNMSKAAEFAEQIGDGKDCEDLVLIGQKDKLGTSLINMRNKLKEVASQDKVRSWINEGLSMISDVLKQRNKTANEMGSELIQKMVEYTGAQQGAIFMGKDDETEGGEYLIFAAGYACGDGHNEMGKILPGEGLIGQAYLEQKIMAISNVPADHTKISSGLIEGLPKHILIIPLVFNNTSEGVVELSSYLPLEDYKVDFLKRISESMASTLLSLRSNEHTQYLLEQSRQQAKKLQIQEGVMLKNQRQLEVSQKDMLGKQKELEQASERVKAQKNSLSTLINNTEDKILALNANYDIKLFNKAFYQFFSLPKLAVIEGANFLSYLKEEEREEWKRDLRDAMNGLITSKEYKFIKAGRMHIFEVNFSLVKENHTINEISIFFRDITDFIRKNERIRRSQDEVMQHSMQLEHTKEAINRSGVATAEYDMEGYLLDANEAYLNILGLTSLDEIVGKHHSVFVPEKDAISKEYENFWETLSSGASQKGQYKRVRPDGTTFWISGSYNTVKEANGRPVMVVKIAVDITENIELLHKTIQQARDLKKSEKEIIHKLREIQEQQHIHQAILHGCVDGVVSFDHEGYITFVNHAATEMIGKEEKNILGRKLKVFIPIEIQTDKYDNMSLYISTYGEGKPIGIRTEASFTNELGEQLDVLLTVSQSKLKNGHHFTIFIQNISVDLF